MRCTTAIILLISMLGTTFSTNCVLLEYALNKRYIAANLCENRGRPEMKCEGKCYLCKKINKDNDKDQETPGHRADLKFQVLSMSRIASFVFSVPEDAGTTQFYYNESACSSFYTSFFHPPQV